MERSSAGLPVDACSECDSTDVIIKKARKSYCRTCWKYRCEFQFRKRLFELGKPPKGSAGEVFRPAEQVLIYYDGSPSSVALVNLAINALVFGTSQQNEGSASKLPFPFQFSILVILESELNGSPGVEGRQKLHLHSLLRWTKYATKVCNGVPCPLLASCLEMSLEEYHDGGVEDTKELCNDIPLVVGLIDCTTEKLCDSDKLERCRMDIDGLRLPFHLELDNLLAELKKSLKTKTEDKDFVNILRRNLIVAVADHLKISKVICPEDQTSLAVKMFSMMSLGRGCQVADEMSFTSSVNSRIVFARPLIDFSDDDLRTYLQTLPNECIDGIVSIKGTNKRKMKIDSVERQCDDFITTLQQGYPATVSTLTRIGSKLQSTTDISETNTSINQCIFCKRQSDSSALPSTPEGQLCYGCQRFINNSANSNKIDYFKSLLRLGNS